MLLFKTSPVLQDNRYDIIIDDGSHVPQHQIISLACLLPALNPGGLYIIEDLETSYWCYSDLFLCDRIATDNWDLSAFIHITSSYFLWTTYRALYTDNIFYAQGCTKLQNLWISHLWGSMTLLLLSFRMSCWSACGFSAEVFVPSWLQS